MYLMLYPTTLKSAPGWVTVKNNHFVIGDETYTFVGANLWYGPNLGASDRPRLMRELDRLQQLGINNIRIMVSSEGPDNARWRVLPALQPFSGIYNQNILYGLDFLLNEMSKRHMYAILCLSNYWHWSGGFGQYLEWSGAGPMPYPNETNDWDQYKKYVEQFYGNAIAKEKLAQHIRFIIGRTNSLTGLKYTDDPTIMTWEISNEPTTSKDVDKYVNWISETAQLIKSLDRNHLVIAGNDEPAFKEINQLLNIDYATTHIWLQNSGWYDPKKPIKTYNSALKRAEKTIKSRSEIMKLIGKPLVIAEFGLARDYGRYDRSATTTYRDHFYAMILKYKVVYDIQGINFWAWSGEGKPLHRIWKPGDPLLGDPPHEPQGWYGIYDTDYSTLSLINQNN